MGAGYLGILPFRNQDSWDKDRKERPTIYDSLQGCMGGLLMVCLIDRQFGADDVHPR